MSERAAETGETGQVSTLPRCTATTVSGEPCKAASLPGKPTCLFHSPEEAGLLKDAQRGTAVQVATGASLAR